MYFKRMLMLLYPLVLFSFRQFFEPLRPLPGQHIPAEGVLLRDVAQYPLVHQWFQFARFQQRLIGVVLGWVDFSGLLVPYLNLAVGCRWFTLAGQCLLELGYGSLEGLYLLMQGFQR